MEAIVEQVINLKENELYFKIEEELFLLCRYFGTKRQVEIFNERKEKARFIFNEAVDLTHVFKLKFYRIDDYFEFNEKLKQIIKNGI